MASSFSLLTRQESIQYLSEKLLIPDVEIQLKTDPKILLDAIVCSFVQRVPYQTITLHLVPLEDRRRPSWTIVKNSIMSGLGGICYELNVFMFALLQGLGYHVNLVDANVSAPNNHLMIVVRYASSSGDLYLVDVGSGFPTFQAVDLTFKEESPVYEQSFLAYKFVKKGGRIFRMHMRRRDFLRNAQQDNSKSEWKRYYDFELKPLTLNQIDGRFDRVFEVPTATSSHRVLRCCFYPGQKACAVLNNAIFHENDSHILEETEYASDQDLQIAICETFKMFEDKSELVKQSIKGWRKIDEYLYKTALIK